MPGLVCLFPGNVLQGLLEKRPLFLTRRAAQRPDVQEGGADGEQGENETNEPIRQESQTRQAPLEQVFVGDQHGDGGQQAHRAEPAAALGVMNHTKT